MFIINKIAVGFVVPDEIELAEKFRSDHPDWYEECISNCICFRKEDNVSYGIHRDDETAQPDVL